MKIYPHSGDEKKKKKAKKGDAPELSLIHI